MTTDAKEPIIVAQGVGKYFEQADGHRIDVISPLDVSIHPNQILALLGPSGSGKSTLLRMLAGLGKPSQGQVLWHGKPLDGQTPSVAIVFQSFALFPWLTVLANVEAPLEAQGVAAIARRKRALRILDTVGLDGFELAYPKELSGGMKQRVGVARALVVEPEVLFMDEPFSALDVLTAEHLRGQLLELWLDRKMPTRAIFIVTHNIEEAISLADRVVILGRNPGRIRAQYDIELPHPRNRKSSDFIGLVDFTYMALTQSTVEITPPVAGSKPGTPAKGKFPMLPHARAGGMAGLVEILSDHGGRDDLYRLAGELALEVDDLLPIVEAATLLGFVTVREGDVEITLAGQRFAQADIPRQKELFRQAVLEHATLIKQIHQALLAKADHTLPTAFFLDILDEHFSQEEAQRQMDTAILWGRFAELFDYDSTTGRLFLPQN